MPPGARRFFGKDMKGAMPTTPARAAQARRARGRRRPDSSTNSAPPERRCYARSNDTTARLDSGLHADNHTHSRAAATPGAPTAAATAEKPESEIDFAARAKKESLALSFPRPRSWTWSKPFPTSRSATSSFPKKSGPAHYDLVAHQDQRGRGYQVFLVALEVNGLTLVRAGKFYKIVEAKEGIKAPIRRVPGTATIARSSPTRWSPFSCSSSTRTPIN